MFFKAAKTVPCLGALSSKCGALRQRYTQIIAIRSFAMLKRAATPLTRMRRVIRVRNVYKQGKMGLGKRVGVKQDVAVG